MSRRLRHLFAAAGTALVAISLLGVSACANQPAPGAAPPAAAAGVPMTAAGPWRTQTIDGEDKVMLEGHDPVAERRGASGALGVDARGQDLAGDARPAAGRAARLIVRRESARASRR